MNTLYKKSELLFSIAFIVIYVVGASVADALSLQIGIAKLLTVIFLLALSVILTIWIKRNKLFVKYGICRPASPSRYLYYIPLIFVVSCNLWFGVKLNFSIHETVLYIISMICVGYLEELIFRGLLFKAMSKNGIRSAIITSSITFGIGHFVNLINGSGAELIPNICQVCSAIAFGFLFVIIFHRSGSLIPCIAAHSILNSLSAFAVDIETNEAEITVSIILTAVAVLYTLILLRTLPKKESK